ncbi:MAG: ribbon-helix-helix domain-containing protein [Thermodesulfovibrionales bacterium]|nr:ribbon-helix-helix domain-containing protein [Thermodesulfovibrionales bacterium]
MPVTKLGISFPVELVEEIDKLSKGLKKSRSEVVRDAITKMINDYKRQQAIEKAEKIYKEIAEDDKRLSEDFLSICAESVAKYKAIRKAKKK